MSIFCTNCGHENEGANKFCGKCGAPLPVAPAETENSAPFVPNPVYIPPVYQAPQPELKLKPKKKVAKLPLIIALIAVVLIGGVTAAFFGVSAKNTKKYEELIDTGNKYLDELKYEEAVETFLEAIEIKPKREEAYVGAAEGYIGLIEPEKAKDILEKGLEKVKKPTDKFTDLCDELGVDYEGKAGKTGNEEKTEAANPFQSVKQGDVITFGSYEQDNDLDNGKEPIEWRVLAVESGKALLISEKVLDAQPYNTELEEVTWETCTLREWLNDDFYKAAFSSEEQKQIVLSIIENPDNSEFGTDGGNNTRDSMFLLSLKEVEQYFISDDERKAEPTIYAFSRGIWEYDDGASWWLRSPGDDSNGACWINDLGHTINGYYDNVNDAKIGLRPAMFVATSTDSEQVSTNPIVTTTENKETTTAKPSLTVTAGQTIKFGSYEQDNNTSNGKEPIEWRVLAVEGGKALLLSDKILDCQPYNTEDEDVTWETCTLREWLNNDFYNTAFSAAEKPRVTVSAVVNEDNPYHGTDGGNDTKDRLFLLSYNEVTNSAYGFSLTLSDYDIARQVKGTELAKSRGLWVVTDNASAYIGNGNWWLRSPNNYQNSAGNVNTYGYVYYNNDSNVASTGMGVRPALWINL